MASLSPFLQQCFDECKFMGTLVSNHLLPSSRERQNCQSNSSGSRILNRGNCCTPKFALHFSQENHNPRGFSDFLKIGSGIDLADLSLATNPELGFSLAFLRRNWILRNSVNCYIVFTLVQVYWLFLKAWLSGIKAETFVWNIKESDWLSGVKGFVPQNFPSHISQDISRITSKWFKIAQELDSQITS